MKNQIEVRASSVFLRLQPDNCCKEKGETAEGSESGPDTFPGIQQNMLCTVTIVERYHRLRLIPE